GRIGSGPLVTFPFYELNYFAEFLEQLKSNNDADPYLRHAAVVGLAEAAKNPIDLWNVWQQVKGQYDTPAVRLGVVLALRRGKSEKCGEFLTDPEPRVAAAARPDHRPRPRPAEAAGRRRRERPEGGRGRALHRVGRRPAGGGPDRRQARGEGVRPAARRPRPRPEGPGHDAGRGAGRPRRS